MIDYMISKGANDWNAALIAACKGRNMITTDDMISKGADNWNDAINSSM